MGVEPYVFLELSVEVDQIVGCSEDKVGRNEESSALSDYLALSPLKEADAVVGVLIAEGVVLPGVDLVDHCLVFVLAA